MSVLENLVIRTKRKMQQAREAKPFDDRCSGAFVFDKCIITFSMSNRHKDIEVWNPVKETYLDCIAEHLMTATPQFDELEVSHTDIWDSNGFRNEQDYINYKYR